MKTLCLLSFTIIFLYLPDLSYASFQVDRDTTQIQKETLEEYKLRIQKQGFQTQTVFAKEEGVLEYKNSDVIKKSKFKKFWKARSIFQRIILIIVFLIVFLFLFLMFMIILSPPPDPLIDLSDASFDF